MFAMFSRVIDNTSYYDLNNRNTLKKVIVKIRLKMQEEVTVEALLDSSITRLVISSEFSRK